MKYIVALGFSLAAFIANVPMAQADTPIPIIARHVCEEIAENPTPGTVTMVVMQLYSAGNTDEQEKEIMGYAMNYTCPEYKPLAIQAVLNIVNS